MTITRTEVGEKLLTYLNGEISLAQLVDWAENTFIDDFLAPDDDVEMLNDILLNGRGIIGNNDPIGPVYSNFYADDIENPTYDPERACTLLGDALLPMGVTPTTEAMPIRSPAPS